jgi:outer membrane protein assembly factor BamE (lipoprotein component of BamABCDE complex)
MNLRRVSLLSVACLALLFLDGCWFVGNRLRKANVDQVTSGMAKKQVESILGMPTNSEVQDYDFKQKTTYIYRQGKDTVTIVFWDDKVEAKETTLTE